MKIKLLALLLAIATVTMSQIQMPLPPETQPGDVVYYDLAGKAYLWVHAEDGRAEALNGFRPEQVYRLLLDRERSCLQATQVIATQLYGMTAQKACPRN
jgi:hypothetical protein